MQAPLIDITMLRVDISGDVAGDATEHDRVRAQRVVEYIRDRVPATPDDDARADPDDRLRPRTNALPRRSKRSYPSVIPKQGRAR